MVATHQVLTYSLREVASMLGISNSLAYTQAREGTFPFPVIQVGEKSWVVPRKAVDQKLNDLVGGDLAHALAQRRGRPRKWVKGEFRTWNFKVPNNLADAFQVVVDNENKKLASPLCYNDARLLAIQEYIERRPID